MTGDRLGGCDPDPDPTVIVVDVVTVVAPEAGIAVVVGDAVATVITGNVAARPGNFDMTDGDPEPNKEDGEKKKKKKNPFKNVSNKENTNF